MEDRIAELMDRLDHVFLDVAQLKRHVGEARAGQAALAAEVCQGLARLTEALGGLTAIANGHTDILKADTRLAADMAKAVGALSGEMAKHLDLQRAHTELADRTVNVLERLAGSRPPDQPEPPRRRP